MRLRHWVANRLILRPTQHAVEAVGLTRCTLPCSGGTIDCFAARQVPRELPSGADADLPTPHPQPATVAADQGLAAAEFDWRATEPPELLVLKLPGTAGRAERSTLFPASLLPERTAEVWTWNPPGYGRSSGRATLASIAAAAVEFYDWLAANRRGSRTVVWISGNSLGCATGLHVATQRPVAGLLLRNPPPLIELVRRRSGRWNWIGGGDWVASAIPHEMDAVATAAAVTAPIVFIQSDADRLVPPALQQHVRDAHPGPQQTVHLPDAEHDTPLTEADRPRIIAATRWLWETTAAAAS